MRNALVKTVVDTVMNADAAGPRLTPESSFLHFRTGIGPVNGFY